ncbi:LPS O-antigen length regulator [Vibrio jasicida]|uniref:Wzz/FepE/Etk N-terminal domain-containing protein n=1 Tax=Vibrio jasicida TaxID=766224 RepID=UPI000CF49C90|nr:Wzz/FepE/Etk N-terminal domain-containing protein [Vibrio jasicida]PQJ65375.1 LPS O-antigen length regulator [Vibrio jasicida]
MEPQKEPNSHYLPYPPQSTEDEIDLRELFGALWKGKWIIIATTFVFAVGSVLYALSLSDRYKADALLAPAETSNGGGLSGMAGQLGGLAALAGVNIGSAESSQTDLAVQVMKSRQFIEGFIRDHDLLIPIMAAKGWDLDTDQLVLDDSVYDIKNDKWLRSAQGLRSSEPSGQEAYKVFVEDIFSIRKNSEGGLYNISITYYSPYLAKQWVELLISDINKVMRERTINETSKNLEYLNQQLEKTAIADMQSTFYKLIEEQTKSLMLAEAQEEFIFKTVDPAVIPEVSTEPPRALICIFGVLLGGLLGVFYVLTHFLLIKRKN